MAMNSRSSISLPSSFPPLGSKPKNSLKKLVYFHIREVSDAVRGFDGTNINLKDLRKALKDAEALSEVVRRAG
jgi:hypothetical protein